jgi:hypothetical protein
MGAWGVLIAVTSGCSRQIAHSDEQLRGTISLLVGKALHKRFDRHPEGAGMGNRPYDSIEAIQEQARNILLAKDVLGLTDNPELSIEVLSKGSRSWRSDYWPVTARVSGRYLFSNVDDDRRQLGIVTFGYEVRMRVRANQPSEIEELRVSTEQIQDLGSMWHR